MKPNQKIIGMIALCPAYQPTMYFLLLPDFRGLFREGSVMWDINIWHIAWTMQSRCQPIRGWEIIFLASKGAESEGFSSCIHAVSSYPC